MATKKKSPGLLGQIEHVEKDIDPITRSEVETGANDVADALVEPAMGLKSVISSGKQALGDKADPKKKPSKGGKPKAPEPTQAEIQAEEEKAIQNNPWVEAGNALTQADEAGAQQAAAAMSPAGINAGIAQANAGAVADVGGGAGAQSWLAAQSAAAANNDSPLMAAMSAYQTAYEQTQPAVQNALQNMGQANALATSVAPEQAYLNLLTGHFGNTNYETLTPAQASGLPPALQYYLGPQGAQVQGVTGKASGAIPSAQAILSGGTSTPTALTGGTGAAPG